MKLLTTIRLYASGTSEGAEKGWESRIRGNKKVVDKVEGLKTTEEINNALHERSAKGGAWVVYVPPFSSPGDPIELHGFKSPSSIPDHYLDVSNSRNRQWGISHGGKFVPWPKGTLYKDQKKSFSGDR